MSSHTKQSKLDLSFQITWFGEVSIFLTKYWVSKSNKQIESLDFTDLFYCLIYKKGPPNKLSKLNPGLKDLNSWKFLNILM